MSRWRRHRKLGMNRWANRLRRTLLRPVEARTSALVQMALQDRVDAYRARAARGEPLGSLEEAELRVFSQNGEDGVLLYLLTLVGWGESRFLEIGIQDGWECNCASLAKHLRWQGLFVEGDPIGAALARDNLAWDAGTRFRDVRVLEQFVTRENAGELMETLRRVGRPDGTPSDGMVDLLSIDIDGMDWWIWQALSPLRPRVAVIEYNAAFGPERSVTLPYQPTFDRMAAHPSGLYYGASLTALERLGRELGYRLVGCESAGVNAFFVRDDLAPDLLPAVPAARAFRWNLYQNRFLAPDQQFQAIAHLPLHSV